MNREQKIELMMRRFVHPNSFYAKQVYVTQDGGTLSKGTYFFRQYDGTCSHTPPHRRAIECSDKVSRVFTEERMAEHLLGEATYAPYQLSEAGTVKWLCIDVDTYDDADEEDVQALVKKVAARIYRWFGANHCLVENSGSKGYHIWVFFNEPLETRLANAFGHTIIAKIPQTDEIRLEVYPKQRTNVMTFGNTVKLPLGVHQKTGRRCVFVSSTFEPYADQWEKLRNVKTVPVSWVHENVTISPYEQEEYTSTDITWSPLCLVDMLRTGAREGIRDESAFKIACYLRDKGIPYDLGLSMMREWNAKNVPPLTEDELDVKCDQGYRGGYGWKPCMLPTFDSVCVSSCPFFKRKVQMRCVSNENIGALSRE